MHPLLHPLDRQPTPPPGRLRPVAEGLWATADEPLRPGVTTAGFLLQRQHGNVFVYSCSAITKYFDHLDELGHVTMVLLNHRDEATPHVSTLADHYSAPVRAHQRERDACLRKGVTAIEPITADTTDLGGGLTAIHTPGHTPGVVSYLWANPDHSRRYLFTGDTLNDVLSHDMKRFAQIHAYDGDVADLISSLAALRDLESDILVPGLGTDPVQAYPWTADQRRQVLNDFIGQLRA